MEGRSPVLTGMVDRSGTRFPVETEAGEKVVNLFVTEMQAGEAPRRVNLSAYRNRPVAVVCQPWFETEDSAWGCAAIGRLLPTVPLRRGR